MPKDPLTPLRQAIRRLEKSDTPLTRRNARNAVRRELASIWKALDAEYRPLRDDGSVIKRTKRKGAYCYQCERPLTSTRALVEHLASAHKDLVCRSTQKSYQCICGRKGDKATMARHLAKVDQCGHFIGAAMARAGRAANTQEESS